MAEGRGVTPKEQQRGWQRSHAGAGLRGGVPLLRGPLSTAVSLSPRATGREEHAAISPGHSGLRFLRSLLPTSPPYLGSWSPHQQHPGSTELHPNLPGMERGIAAPSSDPLSASTATAGLGKAGNSSAEPPPFLPSLPALAGPAGTTWSGSLLSALISGDCSDSVTGLRRAPSRGHQREGPGVTAAVPPPRGTRGTGLGAIPTTSPSKLERRGPALSRSSFPPLALSKAGNVSPHAEPHDGLRAVTLAGKGGPHQKNLYHSQESRGSAKGRL